MQSRRSLLQTIGAFCLAWPPAGAWAQPVSGPDFWGAGATFPFPIYAKWAAAYKSETGIGFNYQPIGSGGGVAQIKAKTVAFGDTDLPLSKAALDASGLIQFPTVVGGIVPVVNLPGIASGEMALDGKTLADIYAGKIVRWNDPAIRRINPGVNLPDLPIVAVHRSDGSGTTFVFTSYLSRAGGAWRAGAGTSVDWPAGIGPKGSAGIGPTVALTPGAIGYAEYAYVERNRMTYVNLINAAGEAVAPSFAAFDAAVSNADWSRIAQDGFDVLLIDGPGAKCWPITSATFVLMPKRPPDPVGSERALKFFRWAFAHGGDMARELEYVPLPAAAVRIVEDSWRQIQGAEL